MGNHKCRTILCQPFQRFLNHAFALIIKRWCGFIENQDRWIFQKNTGNRQSLLLSTGQLDPSLSDIGIVSVWELHDKLMRIGILGRRNDFLSCRSRFSVGNILKYSSGKQIDVLLYHTNLSTQTLHRKLADILAIHTDPSLRHIIEARNQRAKCRFSCPWRSYKRCIRAGGYIQTHMI